MSSNPPIFPTQPALGSPDKSITGASMIAQAIRDLGDLSIFTAADIGSILYPRTAAEIAAGVTPTAYNVPSHDVAGYFIVTRYGGAAGTDNTAAVNRAISVASQQGGGIILFPYVGEWPMNVVITHDSIKFQMVGGRGEFDQYCIRPFSVASPPLTFGDDTNTYRYNGLINCHVSGTVFGSQVTGGSPVAANSAPQAVLLKGGTYSHTIDEDCVLYSGIQTLALVPSSAAPVSSCVVLGQIRNDVSNSASARALYEKRLADPGYNTANTIFVKLNSSGIGYAAEFDGTAVALNALVGGYWDIKPALGILLKGSVSITPIKYLHLDPGTTGVVVIETNNAGLPDLSRYINGGQLFAENQLIRTAYGGGTNYSIPSGTFFYSYNQVIANAFLKFPINISTSTDTFSPTMKYDQVSDTGPNILYNASNANGSDGIGENAHGSYWTRGYSTELITLSTAGLTTDSAANLLPAGSIIEAVVARVTTTITTTTTWALGDATIAQRFAPNNATLVAGTVTTGIACCDQTGTSGPKQTSAAKLRITCTGANPGAGVVRVTVFYRFFVAPTS